MPEGGIGGRDLSSKPGGLRRAAGAWGHPGRKAFVGSSNSLNPATGGGG